VNTLEEILKQILNELKMVNNRIDNLEFNIGELKTDVKELKQDSQQIKQAVFETNETVKRIETKQNEHQKVIEELTYRSVKQEAEIKRIK
jgi:chromosome segregation ATPase